MIRDESGRVRVLIVEDDRRVRMAVRSFLTASEDFDVVGAASDAASALEIARELCPAVVLVDVLLPAAEDGLRLLRVLTSELRVPAVAISIHGWVRGDALAAGAYRFLDKDSEPELLLTALRAAARPATDVAGDRRRVSGPGSPQTLE